MPGAAYSSSPSNLVIGTGYYGDAPGNYVGVLGLLTSTTVGFVMDTGYVGVAPSITVASGDIVSGQFT